MFSVPPTSLSVYRYDPLDRMISQTQTNTPELQRFYCQNRLATEIQGTLRHCIFQHDDLLLAQQQCKNKVIDTTLLATDLQRSVLQTLEAGRPPIPITYAPYGHHSAENGLTSLLGFNGERSDPVTGDYLLGNGYRAFTPVLMRFKSPDSLSPFGKGGFNSYAYCSNDPINFFDPTGRSGIHVALSVARWRGRAAIKIAGLKKLETELAKSGVYKHEGKVWALKPGVDPVAGVKAINTYEYLKSLATHDRPRQGKYLQDLNRAKNVSRLLETQLGVPVAQNPRLKLLNYIKEYDGDVHQVYSHAKLLNARDGVFDPKVRISDRPDVRQAVDYHKEQIHINNPHFNLLWAEADRIKELHFDIRRS